MRNVVIEKVYRGDTGKKTSRHGLKKSPKLIKTEKEKVSNTKIIPTNIIKTPKKLSPVENKAKVIKENKVTLINNFLSGEEIKKVNKIKPTELKIAISQIKDKDRSLDFVINFLDKNTEELVEYQFIGESLSEWEKIENWKKIDSNIMDGGTF